MEQLPAEQIIEEVCNDVCTKLCKYLETTDEEGKCDYLKSNGSCPLSKLI